MWKEDIPMLELLRAKQTTRDEGDQFLAEEAEAATTNPLDQDIPQVHASHRHHNPRFQPFTTATYGMNNNDLSLRICRMNRLQRATIDHISHHKRYRVSHTLPPLRLFVTCGAGVGMSEVLRTGTQVVERRTDLTINSDPE